ncbi:hypothetical protein [Arthrobacter sp. UYCo732]|uniref:hypothetical protein n=1 Tax=Arthrobacter sp. UYCo732 TaxID=3156336 RepID=UPI0033940B17
MTTIEAFTQITPGQSVRNIIQSGAPAFLSPEAAAVDLPDGQEIVRVRLDFSRCTRFVLLTPAGTENFDEFADAVDAAHKHGLPAGRSIEGLVITHTADATTFNVLPLTAFVIQYDPAPRGSLSVTSPE